MNIRPPSNAIILPTIYGRMIVNRYDTNQTNALIKLARSVDHGEIDLLARIYTALGFRGKPVLDVGANFGTYALAFSSVAEADVHAFEAQRQIFNMLCGSVALNGIDNIYCYNVAIGDKTGSIEVPSFDYHSELSFGSVEFGPQQTEKLHQERSDLPTRTEYVPLTYIDNYNFLDVGLIKVDVEGMELDVLKGAVRTIEQSRPLLYVEFYKADKEALKAYIEKFSYDTHTNGLNFIGIPRELAGKINFEQG